MNARERILALGVLSVIVVAVGGFLVLKLFWEPYQERKDSIVALEKEIEKREERVRQIMAERPRLARYRQLSLPADTDLARRDYEKYLSDLFRQSGFAEPPGSFSVLPRPADTKSSPMVGNKVPVYTKLSFSVTAHAELANIVKVLEGFYRTGLLHQVRSMQIQRPLGLQQRPGELDFNLTVEALIVNGAGARTYLLPNLDPRLLAAEAVAALRRGPVGLPLALWAVGPTGPRGPGVLAQPPRQYASIAGKNIFTGPAPVVQDRANEVELTQFVHLTDITRDERRVEAFFYDRYNKKKTRLRAEAGFDSFRIMDDEGETVVRGRVVRIEPRDLIFQADESFYTMHIGQSLEEVMQRPLKTDQLKELGLVAVTEKKEEAEGR